MNRAIDLPEVSGHDFLPGDELLFLPLGGSGEIGMNLNLYGMKGSWLMVDLGITFGDDSTPGIDVICPDPQFIEEARKNLCGIVLTHAHEDHIGAVPYLWERLRCPLYATPFTASILRRKLADAGLESQARITIVPMSGKFKVGPFSIELITLTHSIPEPNAVVIRTPFGTVLHTGDWKIDPEPLVGDKVDEEALKKLSSENVLAMVCDSTNVFREGEAGSESEVRDSLMDLVEGYEGRVAVACFASNLARVETMARVAQAHGRRAVLVGRSLWRFYESARENGYLMDIPPFLAEEEARHLPAREAFLVCTGSQGEPRAALARIASASHPHVSLGEGDVVIFSSRIIPGNERSIGRLQDRLSRLGVAVISENDHFVHVSGHPARDELMRMYKWVQPKAVVPVHGEIRHMAEQARLALSCQVPEAPQVENGDVLRLAPGRPEIIAHAHSGRLVLDGNRLISMESEMFRRRRRMVFDGAAVAMLVVDRRGSLLSDPRISAPGLLESEMDDVLLETVKHEVRRAVETLDDAALKDDEKVRETARIAVRRTFYAQRGHRPVTEVQLIRL